MKRLFWLCLVLALVVFAISCGGSNNKNVHDYPDEDSTDTDTGNDGSDTADDNGDTVDDSGDTADDDSDIDISDIEISDEDSDTPENPETTENHKIRGILQAGSAVSNVKAALFECGKTVELASANTDADGKFSFNADISAEKTYCVKANGFASCFKGMDDHVANISEITNAVYLFDENCSDLRKNETVIRAYAKLGTGKWLGELDYSGLSGIKEGLKLLSSFLNTTDPETLSQKIAEDANNSDRSFAKFFNGFKALSDKKEVVIDESNTSNNEIKFSVEGGSNIVAGGFKIEWTALNSTALSATHKITTVDPGEYVIRAKLVDDGGDPIMISEDSLSVLYLLEKMSGTIDVSDMTKDISHYIDNGVYAVIPKNTVIKKGNNKVNTLTYKILTTGDGSQISKISFEPEGTTFSGDSLYFVYELGTVFGGDPIMLSPTRTNADGSVDVMQSAGGDPIMLEAAGDPIMFSAGGDPIMQIARSAGGDPIMMSAGGDPIMMDAGGDPIMQAAGGDPIMTSAAGDPIMSTAAGDPIMMGTSSSVMIAKTDHFSGFMLNSNSLPRSVGDLIEKWCQDSYYQGYDPLKFIRLGVEKYKPAGADKDELLSYLTCQNFGKLESDLYELINRPLGHQRNLNLFENIFYISEFHNRLKIRNEKAAVKNGLDLKSAIAALYTATTSFNRSSTTADSFDTSMIPMTYNGSSPRDYSQKAQKAVTGLSELDPKYIATKKEMMIFANYITTSSKGPDFSTVSSPLTPDQLICSWFDYETAPQNCSKVYTLNNAGHVATGGNEVSVEEADAIFKKFFMPMNTRLSDEEKLSLLRTFYLVLRYAGNIFSNGADVEELNDELLETAYLVFDGINRNANAVSIVDTFDASAHTVQVFESGEMETKPYLTKLSALTDRISLNVADPANVEKVLIKTEGYAYDKVTENTRTYYKPKGTIKEKSIILNPGNLAAGEKPLKELLGTNNFDELGNITGRMTIVVNSTISGKSYTTQKTYEFLISETSEGVDSKPIPSNLTVFLYDSNEHPIAENKNPGIILNPGNTALYPNGDGIIDITGLAPASYTIDAFADGYYAKNVGVNVPENSTLGVEIRLDEVVTNSAEAVLTVKVKINTAKHPDKVYLQIYDEDMNLVANEAAKFSDDLNTYEDVGIDINFGRFTFLAVGEEMYNYVETITVNNENTIKEITVVAKNACGNGIVDSGEECEVTGSEEPEEVNCGDIYPASTNPENKTRCNAAICVYDKTGCGKAAFCGDGIVDLGEGCDGGTKDCSEILGTSAKGTVPCAANCSDWITADNCTRTLNDCTNLPEHAIWNDGIGRFSQTWNGESWLPAMKEGLYGTTRSECVFSCIKGYKWDLVDHKCTEDPLSLGNICTGQTSCFDSLTITGECPAYGSSFFGQDAQYAAAGFCTQKNFSATGTGNELVIVDDHTHFEWQKSSSDGEMSWAEADEYCMQLNYDGTMDWRLPTPLELLTIVDNAALAGIFGTSKNTFWSTEDAKNNANAWKLGANGELTSVAKSTQNFVICIRDYNKETTTDRFTTDDETVADNESGLIWQKNSTSSRKNWREALDYCENLTASGHYDWRLPNRNELASIIDFEKTSGVASGIPNVPAQVFWTSTSSANAADMAWTIDFGSGSISESAKSDTNYVLCVRSENICLGDESECTNACSFEPCGEIEHSTGFCTSAGGSFYCGCKSGFTWNMINASCSVEETRYAACVGLPANAKWNTVSGISQMLAGDDWYPDNTGKYNENPSTKECHFICEGYFEWDEDTGKCVHATQLVSCGLLPYAHTEWTGDNYITQTWNGMEWLPRVSIEFSETAAENKCRFKCAENYNWNGSNSCDAATNENVPCTGLPSGASWNTVSKIKQTWNGSAWMPKAEGEYNEEASTEECRFKCKADFAWDGTQCVNPCSTNPCSGVEHASGSCIPQTSTAYYCGCENGYRWNGYECEKVALGNLCTDQTYCYDYNSRLLKCPDKGDDFYMQDAQAADAGICLEKQYSAGSTITADTNTGLYWQRGNGTNMTWQEAENYCASQNFSGLLGWRLPTPTELVSILDKSGSNPAFDIDSFDIVANSSYWTSQELASDDTKAWIMNPVHGTLSSNDKNEQYAVKCVNGDKHGYADKFQKFTNYGELVVVDENTHFFWERQPEYITLLGTWRAAFRHCKKLNDEKYLGHDDWRVPNLSEMFSIVNYDNAAPASTLPELKTGRKYWTSTSNNGAAETAMAIDFETGELVTDYKRMNGTDSVMNQIMCIRSSVCNDSDCVNACANNPCKDVEHSNKICTAEDETKYSCGCDENYYWDGAECVSPCNPNPCEEIENSTGNCFFETFDSYSCECNGNYFWNGEACIEDSDSGDSDETGNRSFVNTMKNAGAQTNCNSNPCDNISHSTGICIPKNGSYKCECEYNYLWNGTTCVNPCDAHPCDNVSHSTGICISRSWGNYTCECEDGYYWWGKQQGCTAQRHNLGSICTGQTKCYDNSKEIECPESGDDFFGQDANYANSDSCVPHSFSVYDSVESENIVIDRNTGLQWQQIVSNYTDWNGAVAYCENLEYGGYSDWRLPNPNELFSIVNNGRFKRAAYDGYFQYYYLSSGVFTTADAFWSSKSVAFADVLANYVNFEFGYKSVASKNSSNYVRCVRGEELPNTVFVSSTSGGDEIVTDINSGLVWQKNSVNGKKWGDAAEYCENLTYAGHDDWRLPNKNELITLINYDEYDVASDFPEILSATHWSSSTRRWSYSDALSVWTIELAAGGVSSTVKEQPAEIPVVRCVRSDICGAGEFWNGSACEANPCNDNPCGSSSHSVCIPLSAEEHKCSCDHANGYFPNGSTCVNPCDADPCGSVANSTHECTPRSSEEYTCSCESGYFWDASSCVNPCNADPCGGKEHSICTPHSTEDYTCSCESGYFWLDSQCIQANFGRICTGQDRCYNNSSSIACPSSGASFFGQDAQYANQEVCVPKSFTMVDNVVVDYDSNSGISHLTLIDNNTGLEWEKTVSDGTKTWEEAAAYCENLEDFSIITGEVVLRDDWRLPTIRELLSVIDPVYDPETYDYYFQESGSFWSSESYSEDLNRAWYMIVPDGYSSHNYKETGSYYVRCVRGSSLPDAQFHNFSVGSDTIVTDATTHLVWQQNYVEKTWQEALEYCEQLNYAGLSNWHLPNRNELASLLDNGRKSPASDFPDMPSEYFWSSTTKEEPYYAWGAGFSTGQLNRFLKTTTHYVRCVHSDICNVGELWNGSTCVINPCRNNPCGSDANSVCILLSAEEHTCLCDNSNGYFSTGSTCVNPCDADPCGSDVHSTHECTPQSLEEYACSCENGYFWNGLSCVNPCDSDPCGSDAHSTHECTPQSLEKYACSCENGYFWDGSQCRISLNIGNICTGQNSCYNASSAMTCPSSGASFFGQDAQYRELGFCTVKSFSIIETGENTKTVFDNNTGLEWQQTISDETKTWSQAQTECSELDYANHDDWRLPTRKELLSIIDSGRSNPAADTAYFTGSGEFWTSKSYAGDLNSAWYVDFSYGASSFSQKNEGKYVRCVRGTELPEATSNKFVSVSGTVTDTTSGLVWQQIRYQVSSSFLSNTWEKALEYCDDLTLAGYRDWRLPNKNELISLLYNDRSNPASNFTSMAAETLWSSSTVSNNNSSIWVINFATGEISSQSKSSSSAIVLCVRSE